MKTTKLPRPTDTELAILRVLWRLGPATVRAIHAELCRAQETGYTTVLKMLQIMTEKGLVTRDESERSHVYQPACAEQVVQRQLLRHLLERAFGGSAQNLGTPGAGGEEKFAAGAGGNSQTAGRTGGRQMSIWMSDTVVRGVGWTLVHFVWEGLAIGGLLAVALRMMRSRPAHWRYLAGCAAMALMAVAPLVTFQIVLEKDEPAPVPVVAAETVPSMPGAAIASAEVVGPTVVARPPIVVKATWTRHEPNWAQRVEGWMPWLVMGWLAGVCVLSCRLLAGWCQVRRLGRRAEELAGPWAEKAAELAVRLGVRHSIQLLQSALVEVPTVIGWLRPVILLPASCLTGLTPGQLEALLAHELAHIRRHDYLINLLQSAVETLLFYHPAVWWVSGRVREERENCCDDLAVAVSGDRAGYARALATLEELRPAPAQMALAAGGGSLVRRIRRLAGKPATQAQWESWPVAGLVVVLGMALVAMGMREHGAQAAEEDRLPVVTNAPSAETNRATVIGTEGNINFAITGQRMVGKTNDAPVSAASISEAMSATNSVETATASKSATEDGPAAISPSEPLEVRTFRVDPKVFAAALKTNDMPEAASVAKVTVSGPGFGVPEGVFGSSSPVVESAIRDFFHEHGIDLSPERGRVVVYNDRKGMLTVRASSGELDLIEALIISQNAIEPEINIKVRFVEFDEPGGALPQVASGENLLTYLLRTARDANARGSNVATGLQEYRATASNGIVTVTSGTNEMKLSYSNSLAAAPTIPGAFSGDTNLLAAAASGTLSEAQFRTVMTTLANQHGTQALGRLEVTTENGRQAQLQMVNVQQVVTGLTSPGGVPSTASYSFGPELDVVPYVNPDQFHIKMAIIASDNGFLGYDNPGPFTTTNGVLYAVVPLPHFQIRQAAAYVTVGDGDTAVIAGFAPIEGISTAKTKVPVLGDIPLLGRLFQSTQKKSTKRGLIVFVTPTLVNPDGTRFHSDSARAAKGTPPPGGN